MKLHQISQAVGNVTRLAPFTMAMALALVATTTLLPVQSVRAQSAQVIEEVVVTARKRQETLQEVPVVVNVLTEDAISSQRIENIRDISTIVPGMVAAKSISGTSGQIYLRGIGTGSGNPAFDQAVAINIDGMGVNSAQLMNAGMFDLRQIEVLKGPQALFFGKNSPGGVIAIHTNDPGDEFELELTGMYESVSEETTLRGIVSGPITDTLGARLAFGYSDSKDNWVSAINEDRFEDGPFGPVQTAHSTTDFETETTFVLGTLLWEPTDTFSAKLKVAHLQDDESGPVYGLIQKVWCPNGGPQGAFYPVAGYTCKADDRVISPGLSPTLTAGLKDGEFAGERHPFFDNENNLAVLEMNYDLDDSLTLTSVTGYFDNEETRLAESSFEVAVGLPATFLTEIDQWSQELRLVSSYEGALNFTLGAYYEDKEIHRDSDVSAGVPALVPVVGALFPLSIGRQISTQEGTAWSVFAQLNWEINEQWTLAIGGRYADEEKEFVTAIQIADPNVYGIPGGLPRTAAPLVNPKEDWTNFSPEATLSYQYTDDIMFFASYREGFKSGGYDMSYGIAPRLGAIGSGIGLDNTYNEENVDGFEIGMKSTLLDDTLRFNVTAFSFNYEDLQLSKFDGDTLSFSLFNAGEATVNGLEFEAFWVTPVEGLSLTANLALLDAEFDEFLSPCWSGQTIAMGCDTQLNPVTGNFVANDMAGESLPFASDVSAALGANYDTSVGDSWNLSLNFTASYKDDYNPLSQIPVPGGQQDSYWWLNAGATLYSSNNRWEVFVRAVNLTDEVFINGGGAAPGQGDPTLSGSNDASGVPDWIAFVQGGRQINAGFTYRMGRN